MFAIEPDMVLGKQAVDGAGVRLGEIVDVGLYTHSRVKFLVVEGKKTRRVGVEEIEGFDADVVRLSAR